MFLENENKDFLGTGWGFPPTFNLMTHTVDLVSDEEDIKQSLYILFSTIPGERVMNPKYGCDLLQFVFDEMNLTTETLIKSTISRAILLFEPRIKVEEVDVKMDVEKSIIYIEVFYYIIKINTRNNVVFPFYLREGTNLRLDLPRGLRLD